MDKIVEHIVKNHVGVDNAVFSKDLEKQFHCAGTEIRANVNRARQAGIPICSGNHGYYLANTVEEVEKTITQLENRIMGLVKAKNGLETYLHTIKK